MNSSREARFRQIMSGEDAAAGAKALRAAAAVVEPFYAAVTQLRNPYKVPVTYTVIYYLTPLTPKN